MATAILLALGCGGGGDGGAATGPPGGTPAPGTGGTGGSTGGGTGASTSTSIGVADNRFTPAATTVPVGAAVTWTWSGSAPHNVIFDDGAQSPTQTSGSYVRTFNSAGSFAYQCTVHGAAMSGTVTVR